MHIECGEGLILARFDFCRHAVREVVCYKCELRQPVGPKCVDEACGNVFGAYFWWASSLVCVWKASIEVRTIIQYLGSACLMYEYQILIILTSSLCQMLMHICKLRLAWGPPRLQGSTQKWNFHVCAACMSRRQIWHNKYLFPHVVDMYVGMYVFVCLCVCVCVCVFHVMRKLVGATNDNGCHVFRCQA